MDYQTKADGTTRSIALIGRLTFDANEKFRAVVDLVMHDQPQHVAVDLARLEFVDSAGLGMLLLLREAAQAVKARLVLLNPTGQVGRLLSVSHFGDLIAVEGWGEEV